MNVEIWTDAAQFLSWEYITRIFGGKHEGKTEEEKNGNVVFK